jgi:RNA polymerase sigma factor (sigma-70 family)
MTNKTDSELVALARSGNKEAFGELIERYQQMVRRIALGMVAHEEVARDLAQEAILQAYLSLDHLRDNTRFKSWLYGIVLNVCRGYIRDQKTDLFSLEAMMGGMYRDMPFFPSGVIDPEEVAEQRELHRIVLNAIQHLLPKDRLATLLFYYEQLSLREIAAILGVSVPAVKGRLYRAREQLRERLLPVYADLRSETEIKQGRKTMAEVKVAAVTDRDDGAKHSVVTLLDEAGRRILNIWIMDRDALVIALGVTGTAPIRPMSMHLMVNLLKATGMELEEVRIEMLKDDVFYAVTKIRNGKVSHELDARPSDAIALSVLMDKPIYVAEEVLERCGVILPEGKTLQVDKVHGAMLKKVEEVSQRTPQTAEEREEAHRRLIAILMGE